MLTRAHFRARQKAEKRNLELDERTGGLGG